MDLASNAAYSTPFAVSPLLPLLLFSLAQQKNAPKTSKYFKEEYDYVIVGAGAAGAVVASRLSEVPCVSVLLLEAGKSPPILNDVPVLAGSFLGTDMDWKYKTVPQKHSAFGLVNKQVTWPSGKGLGGSSLLNGMMYVRGNRKNYDDWARQGAVGWSYSDVFPYFLKLEDNNDRKYLADGYHVVGGPVSVDKPRYEPEIKKPLLETADLLGYKIVDPNGRSQTGYYDHQAFERNGQRCSSAKSHLVPAENRTNLDILTHAFVRKVLIKSHRAVGVEFDYKNSTRKVWVKREVILSAGSINTAQLLMLSGIGPKKHLLDLKIPLAEDLPVGDNLQDHCGVPVPFQTDPGTPSVDKKLQNETLIQEYIDKRTGLLTSTDSVSLIAFLNGPQNTEAHVPDFQLYFAEVPPKLVQQKFDLTNEIYEKSYGPYENSSMYLCIAQILHPKSRGTVRLQSANPYDPPLIDPNYFADTRDLDDAVNAIKTCHKIGTSEIMQKSVGSRHLSNLVPGCEHGNYSCIARTIIGTLSHQVGTAKMGDPKDPHTVVDPRLRVKNINGLRVVDASIMPIIPSGNTYIPTVMMAEKASDMIKSTIECYTQIPFISRNEFPSSPNFEDKQFSP